VASRNDRDIGVVAAERRMRNRVRERFLRSGERVKCEAVPNADEVMGVRLWLHGKDVYVWRAR
jgi:hypothetical protein